MGSQSRDEQTARRYLLGQLSEAARSRYEERYLAEEDSFDTLLVIEEELIDDFVRGRLPKRERNGFERHFLTSAARRRRTKIAEAWASLLSGSPTGPFEPPEGSRWLSRPYLQQLREGIMRRLFWVVLVILPLVGGFPGGKAEAQGKKAPSAKVKSSQPAAGLKPSPTPAAKSQMPNQEGRLTVDWPCYIDDDCGATGRCENGYCKFR